ncbi:MAG: CTP synthase, partial [Nitrosopumilaceae archaeon]|nr:CTP synthase [Nitrosopumilaceae archaeon]
PLQEKTKKKIALFTNVTVDEVLSCHDVKSIFQVPQILYEQGIVDSIFRKFGKVGLVNAAENWDNWNTIVESMINHEDQQVKIAMVGKYVTLADSYVSVNHALKHAGAKLGKSVKIDWIDSESIEDYSKLSEYDGILVPGGFGNRGAEGIIKTANFARENNIPYLGICFGFQLAAVAFARNVLKLENADSTEIEPDTKNPIIDLLPEQKNIQDLGGSLRLGANEILIKDNTMSHKIYKSKKISKRHRHRYEVNKDYIPEFEKNGLIFSADSDNGKRMEILEIPNHKFYVGVQFHPEFSSRPGFPEAVFEAFISAAAKKESV